MLFKRAAFDDLGVLLTSPVDTIVSGSRAQLDDPTQLGEIKCTTLSLANSPQVVADAVLADVLERQSSEFITDADSNPIIRTVAFIDLRVANYLELAATFDPSVEVVFLDASEDGVQQIADWLDGRSGIDAVHIVSHGAEASLQLGSAELNTSTLPTYAALLSKIGSALSSKADILLYGCDLASGPEGRALVERLALLTGADVAASNNLTGASFLGGDSDLEITFGDISTTMLIEQEVLDGLGLLLVDVGSTPGTAGSISVNGSISNSIEVVGDTDWFAITLSRGVTYKFDLEGSATGGGTLTDPFLRLRDSSGVSILSDDDDGTGLNSFVTFYAPSSGTYHLSVGSAVSGIGTYRLTATALATDWTRLVDIPDTLNVGIHEADNTQMQSLLGAPNIATGTPSSQVSGLLETRDVDPTIDFVTVQGIRPALDSLEQIFSAINADMPGFMSHVNTDGMLNVRNIAGTSVISNHSWGIAVDLFMDSTRDVQFDNHAEAGLAALIPYFQAAGWVTGAGWASLIPTREDSMHFEVSLERLQLWQSQGLLSPQTPGSVSISDLSITEGNSGTKLATFTVTRTGGTAAFAVNYGTSDGGATTANGDYVGTSGTLNFGTGVNSQTISVTINGDTSLESDEAFFVNLSGATNGAAISDNLGIGTILNDDSSPPGSVSISDLSITEGNSGTKLATFTVTRTGGTAAFAVNYGTSDGGATTANGDYVGTSGTLNFGTGVNSQTISVTINGDTSLESDEAFFVNLSGATNGAAISDNLGIGTILNDDSSPPGSVSISDLSITEGNSGTKLATFTVTRTGGTAAFAVNYGTSDGGATTANGDYVGTSGTLNFGTGVNSQTISVTINGDTSLESDEAFFVNLSGATNGAAISDNLGIGTILNDDSSPPGSVSISDLSITEGNSGTKLATFTVTRTGGTAAFAVNYGTSDGGATTANGDYVGTSGTLNFGTGVNSQTISVTINGDTSLESDEAFFVNLSGATNGAAISDNLGIGTILNDDSSPPGSVSISDLSITEGNSGTKLATFTVTRTGGTAAFAVNYGTSDGGATTANGDYVGTSGTLNFGTGVNSQTISVTINGDTSLESDEAFFVNLSGATNGAAISDNLGIGTITNDDGELADLQAFPTGISTSTIVVGSSATLTYELDNFSSSPAGSSTTAIYLSPDNIINASDLLLTTDVTAAVTGGGFVIDSVLVNIPNTVVPGFYYIGAFADLLNAINETSETNNAGSGLAITINPGPDDFADSFADSTAPLGQVSVTGSSTGNLEVSGDQDWFQVSLVAGTSYEFDLIGGTLGDTILTLYNSAGNFITSNDDWGSTLNSHIAFLATSTGSHYLAASGFGTHAGTYTLSASSGLFTEAQDVVALTLPDGTWHALGGSDNVTGTESRDVIFGDAGNDILIGEGGNDDLYGGTENDLLVGGLGSDFLDGGEGADALKGGGGIDTLLGGMGDDTFDVDVVGDIVAELVGQGTDTVHSSTISLSLASYANVENLTLLGTLALNLTGNAGANLLTGNTGANRLAGGSGKDSITGDLGNDTITGGLGRDVMIGGADRDVFDFNLRTESGVTSTTRDIIMDFRHLVDDIDLRTIDASTLLAGNNNFIWRGTGEFTTSKAGEVRFQKFNNAGTTNDYTIVYGDTDGDTTSEFQIKLTGLVNLTSADFIL